MGIPAVTALTVLLHYSAQRFGLWRARTRVGPDLRL
jgi:hypothetical protein